MQVYVYTLSFGSLCAHRSVNPRGNASAYTPAKPETVATPDPAVGPTRGLQVTRRQSGTAVSEDGGSADHCPNQLVQDQLFTGTGRACGRERKKPVHEGPAQMTRLHRKPLRPFGYRLLNEAAGSGTGFALIRRLNGWAREVVWESHWSCKVAQGR